MKNFIKKINWGATIFTAFVALCVASLVGAATVFINQGGTATTTAQSQGIYFYNGTLASFSQDTSANGLRWNFTTNRLGVGSTTPGTTVSIGGDGVGINLNGNGTSTFSNGIVLAGGCIYKKETNGCISEIQSTLTGILEQAGGVVSTVTVGSSLDYTGTTLSVGTVAIGDGGTNATSQTTNGINYYNGTSITSGSTLTWNGTVFANAGSATSTFAGGLQISVTKSGSLTVGTSTARGIASFDGEVAMSEYGDVTCTGAVVIDWSRGNKQVCTITGNVTSINFAQGDPGTVYRLTMCQDGTGNRTIRGWGADILFATGALSNATSTPGHTTKINTCNIFQFDVSFGTSTMIYMGTLPLMTY